MAWKKDLAKLKQDLAKEDPAPPKTPPPPKAAPTAVSKSIEEEDAIFLSAMGLRPQAQPRPTAPQLAPAPAKAELPPPPPPPTGSEFGSAMGELKGMKPLRQHPAKAAKPVQPPAPKAPSQPEAPQAALAPPAPVLPLPVPPPPALETRPPAPAGGAVQIHLAAGMAIDVDGTLDLRGHGRLDGEERLKERILDGFALGWRTLHVHVGPAPDLRDMVLEVVKEQPGGCVARYAQAPIPMGGAQAWILYFKA